MATDTMRLHNYILNDFWLGLLLGLIIGSQAVWGCLWYTSDAMGLRRMVRMPEGADAVMVFRPRWTAWTHTDWFDWYVPVKMEAS